MDRDPTTEAELDAGPDGAPFSPWRLLPVAVILAGLAAFWALGGGEYLSFDALRMHREDLLAWRDMHLVLAATTFTVVYALAASFSLPGAVWLTLAGAFLFGTWQAALCVVVGATVGATAVFLAARYALGDVLRRKAGPAIRKMEDGFRENALSYMLFLRLVPLFPFWLVNLVPAFLGVPLGTYVLGTFLGIIPGTVVYCLVGNGLGAVFDMGGEPDLSIIFKPQILAPIVGLAVLSLVPIVYKRMKRR
ncbi:MAG: TVP38/TMEM64 family protein [Hyphomicrobiales bacterium]|nr:TVP38/TMEM64 family protein [Hyphomicrobiales bacterium]